MFREKKIVCVIPARLGSTRFPRKILADVSGKSLLQWVYEAASRCKCFDDCIIALDHEETAAVVDGFGGRWMMTSDQCQSGTDRLVEIQASGVEADVWVNWQADGPMITETMIEELLASCDEDWDVWTLMHKFAGDVRDPSQVKVVFDQSGQALYFSRSPIPYNGDAYWKHVGLYAYSNEALQKIGKMDPTQLEKAEKLEQLRFLENGMRIRVHETPGGTVEVDLPEHLELVQQLLKVNSEFRC